MTTCDIWLVFQTYVFREGHDPRFLEFSPEDGISGGHHLVLSQYYWKVGCLGITETCTNECEESFLKCMEGKSTKTALKRVQAFGSCMAGKTFKKLKGCTLDCAPSFKMLSASQLPTKYAFETFGAPKEGSVSERPAESRCVMEDKFFV